MRSAPDILLAATTALAQSPRQNPKRLPTPQKISRGVSAVSRNIAWASGAHGTYLTHHRRRTLPGPGSPPRFPNATISRLPRRSRLLRRRSFPDVRRSRRAIPHLPHHRCRAALAASIHQPQSQRELLRLTWSSGIRPTASSSAIPSAMKATMNSGQSKLKFELLITTDEPHPWTHIHLHLSSPQQ